MQDSDAGGFKEPDYRSGRVAGRLDDCYAFIDDCTGVGRVVGGHEGRKEGEVNAELMGKD